MKSFNYIKSTFLRLTSKTYPYGTEDGLVSEMTKCGLFPNLEKDSSGNYFYKIGDSRTIFTSHLDTACKDQTNVKHNINKQQIVSTDGRTILGADDKAGVTMLLWLIKNKIPGLYYFFIGEEVGCIGSYAHANVCNFKGEYDRMISFDRRGTNSVITHQSSSRSCSDEFASALSKELNKTSNLYYKPDSTGVYTDSAEFVDIISECTNISVGYTAEHTYRETQDLYHLHKLALACIQVDWENLPTKRVAGTKEYSWKDYSTYDNTNSKTKDMDLDYAYGYGWASKYRDEDEYPSSRKKRNRRKRYQSDKYNNYNFKKNRSFYDSVDGLVEYPKKDEGKWDVFRDKFLSTDITFEEIALVREQLLDFTDPLDKAEFEKINKNLFDK